MSAPPETPPRPWWTVWETRARWAGRLLRRTTFLALMGWSALVCATRLAGPHWEAAAVGLVCCAVVLWDQGGWVWRRYRRHLR